MANQAPDKIPAGLRTLENCRSQKTPARMGVPRSALPSGAESIGTLEERRQKNDLAGFLFTRLYTKLQLLWNFLFSVHHIVTIFLWPAEIALGTHIAQLLRGSRKQRL